MGREQELRDAARDGNVSKLESLLAAKKSSLMSSLRKNLDINCQDENGNTALHLASLNGKKEAAELLLRNDASANIPETLGNYPLHLAAFNGHHDVTNTLINHGPSRAEVLQQNSADDTALHIAAQYGHTQVVKTLLENHADPHMRNKKGESPLDLAAMYGRLPTVQVLILSDNSLVRDQHEAHSPLHLAARNGHTSVIDALLDFGMSVNSMCKPGTALHEAALFGKVEAVKLLLKKGIDVNATNDSGDTVVDLLEDLPSERSQEITALIYEQTQVMMNSVQTRSKSMSITSQSSNGMVPGMPSDRTSDSSNHYSKITSSRSSSVSQRRPQPAYSVVQFPRLSRTDQSLAEATISPLPFDASSQDDLFNDRFLREVKIPSPTSVQPPEQQHDDVSSLQSKKRVPLNVYEQTQPPDPKPGPAPVYDTVPPPRPSAGSTTSNSNRDSIPSIPPPSSDQALTTLRRYVEEKSNTNEEVLRNPQNGHSIKQQNGSRKNNTNDEDQRTMSDFEKLHLRMSPPLVNNDMYKNVNISNRPSAETRSNQQPDMISFNNEQMQLSASEQTHFAPVKQKRTRSSVKGTSQSGDGSRPASTLNESYEWSKIDKIFSSFEDLIQCDINLEENDMQQIPDSVGDWLTNLGLSHYEASFVANGYDDIRFIGGDMLDEDDLREIGIQKAEHLREILMSASNLPSPPQIGEGDFPIPESISEWLSRINLSDYETRFKMNGYESMDRVRAIWEFELTTVIGIHLNGHRKRMIYSLGRRPEQEREKISWSKKFADAEAPKTAQPSSGDDAMDLANQLLKAAEDMVQGFENRQGGVKREEEKEPAQPTTPKSPTSPKILKYKPSFQWIHKPEALLYSAVIYETQYLGSHPVMVVRGTESTVDACKKMKSTSKMLQKIPSIQLSISVRGIDFIDAQSNSTISSYDIRYISYCAQDPDDLAIFAYITKDARSGKNYCHVFKGSTLSLTDEIVLTIGQAFELAYHQHRVLIEGAKGASSKEGDQDFHAASNDLQIKSTVKREERAPPPMPKPYDLRKKN